MTAKPVPFTKEKMAGSVLGARQNPPKSPGRSQMLFPVEEEEFVGLSNASAWS